MTEEEKVSSPKRKMPFVSARTLREGSVGLLLLVGLGVLGIVILWLNRFAASGKSYTAVVEFANAGGMQKGAVVRYRGVKVGRINSIQPGPNNVDVEIEISQPELIIPRDVTVEANQSGLISESIIDITPKKPVASGVKLAGPLDPNCDRNLVICNGSRLQGVIGISMDELIRTTSRLATVYTEPRFYANVNNALKNTSVAASQIAKLSGEIVKLTKNSQAQLSDFATAAKSVSDAADKIGVSTSQAVDKLGNTANEFGTTAKDISLTVNQANQLLQNLDDLVVSNRSSLVTTLNNITATSNQLRASVDQLSPTFNRLTQGELINNLESLSANAAQASANLLDASKTLNNPNNLLVLQKTLDSARVTFENTQKITADLDELTGDPKFRKNLQQLVNGLSGLVSSTQQIEQKVQLATTLESVKTSVNTATNTTKKTIANQPEIKLKIPDPVLKNVTKKSASNVKTPTAKTSQENLLKKLRKYRQESQKD
ncbi:MlaD family protein [Calothrix rhizosoleniae]|uniref:MlaD family protein n=1 Tax=Calothrix rhizosoleniae TaxID=888997 RepID=UPI000B49D3F6|nr:MlaD family protein [Calothrix rhizosoleniae]